ncbi:MAG: DUF3305 domain-containing protein [Burkholderiaceae bacterium]
MTTRENQVENGVKMVPARWVKVVIGKRLQESEWQPFRWELESVEWCPHIGPDESPPISEDPPQGVGCYFKVTLYPDEADGYYLNLTSSYPAWFVHWRLDEEETDSLPAVNFVTLSYNEAGRILDSSELVENLPVDPDTASWLAAFTQDHFVPEPRKRQRPQSFKSPGKRLGVANE